MRRKENQGYREKDLKSVWNRQPGAFLVLKKKESEHCLFVNNAYCGLNLSVVYLVDMGNMTN